MLLLLDVEDPRGALAPSAPDVFETGCFGHGWCFSVHPNLEVVFVGDRLIVGGREKNFRRTIMHLLCDKSVLHCKAF